MSILMLVPNFRYRRPRDDNEYKLKEFLKRVLKGTVQVNLDGYFPYREDPEEDYKELRDTQGLECSHLVIITSPIPGVRIRQSYLDLMDLVLRGNFSMRVQIQ